jgi:hypothetical protein
MTVKERISSAQSSKDLGEVSVEDVGDIDVVRACGMVGAKFPLGVALWRLKYAADTREFRTVLDGLVQMMEKRWPDEGAMVSTVATVVRHWLDDVCHACNGLGFKTLPGVPVLSDEACEVCEGSGRLKLQRADEPALWLQETIARMEREVAAAIMKKLNSDLEF